MLPRALNVGRQQKEHSREHSLEHPQFPWALSRALPGAPRFPGAPSGALPRALSRISISHFSTPVTGGWDCKTGKLTSLFFLSLATISQRVAWNSRLLCTRCLEPHVLGTSVLLCPKKLPRHPSQVAKNRAFGKGVSAKLGEEKLAFQKAPGKLEPQDAGKLKLRRTSQAGKV